jgi:hypothetical protein
MHSPFAYLDAGSGSMILQIILGGVAAVAVALKMWWRRVLRLLHIRKPDEDEPVAEPISAAHDGEVLDSAREPVGKS